MTQRSIPRALVLLALPAAAAALLAGCGLGYAAGGAVLAGGGGSSGGGNQAPAVAMQLVPRQKGDITIAYSLSDPEGEAATILVEWTAPGQSGFLPATERTGGASEGLTSLAASASGTPHVFVWDSATDLGGTHAVTGVQIRITPTGGAPQSTPPFIAGNDAPTISLALITLPQTGFVVLTGTVGDSTSDLVDLSIEVVGVTLNARIAIGATTGLTTPAAVSFAWDSLADLPNANTNVTLRVRPRDQPFADTGTAVDRIFPLTNEPLEADLVLGQPSFGVSSVDHKGLSGVEGIQVAADGTVLLADFANNRVLVMHQVPSTDFQAFDLVLGQTEFFTNTSGTGLDRMNGPSEAFYDSARDLLFVSDTTNGRVLIWDGLPATSGAAAQRAITGLSQPRGIHAIGNQLFIAETGADRVSVYDTGGLPGSAPTLSFNLTQGPGPTAMNNPLDVFARIDGATARLYVADPRVLPDSERILVWTGATLPSAAAAATSQILVTENHPNRGPTFLYATATTLYASKSIQQVLRFAVPAFTPLPNVGVQSCTAGEFAFCHPRGISGDGTSVLFADRALNRIMVFDEATIPAAPAFRVIGQRDFFSGGANHVDPDPFVFNSPSGIATDGTALVVGDANFNRVLVWNTLPETIQRAPDLVISQQGFFTNRGDEEVHLQSGFASGLFSCRQVVLNPDPYFTLTPPNTAQTRDLLAHQRVRGPQGVALGPAGAGQVLAVADGVNHRVLIWFGIPAVDYQSADVILGDKVVPANGEVLSCPTNTAIGLQNPDAVATDNARLAVADTQNDRVMIWDPVPAADEAPASLILDNTSLPGLFLDPKGVLLAQGKLIVSDTGHNRVLIWSPFPVSASDPPDVVIGQTAISGLLVSAGTAQDRLRSPTGLAFDGERLFVVDSGNHRVMIFEGIPTANGAPASELFGQPLFAAAAGNLNNTANNGGVGAGTVFFFNPLDGAEENSRGGPSVATFLSPAGQRYVWLTDPGNNRVLRVPLPPP